ncbi:serine hydrolase [Modestobacter sp. VKM Ac-2986]|uniref:serine hydrolase domain-containing protein n=1 Tax=Modestobacter sp. VKM Ac-2986 TaxID=3004140 RepID=UPI0022AB8FA8|nr:serine hydrolase domain-containing protein [Modestobacter sp. VKM Ac-2986]MCZ2829968.1 serine hydrolase [Modestobacter sp. VKM Ac-2986]
MATGAALAALVGTGLLAPATASATPGHTPAPLTSVQQDIDALVSEGGFPAVLGSVVDGRGRIRDLAAGVADVTTGEPAPVNGRVRIASNTKTFTATVVLQLVAERRIGLDQTVEHHLPGLVRGPGGDGREITVRELLQHTSGLPDYDDVVYPEWVGTGLTGHFTPQQLVAAGLGEPATPQGVFSYSNTNYVLAGMVVEEVTGRSIADQIDRRIIKPLELKHTYWPADDDLTIRGTHPHTYTQAEAGGPLTDVTELDPSIGGAAGQLISTPHDLAVFFGALLDGELLPPAQLAQMTTTVPAPDLSLRGIEMEYGLGLASHELPCGVEAWGHGGDLPGVHTRNAFTEDGRGATFTVTGEPANADPEDLHQYVDWEDAVDDAVCAQPLR